MPSTDSLDLFLYHRGSVSPRAPRPLTLPFPRRERGVENPLLRGEISLQTADINAVLGAAGVDDLDRGEARFAEHAARRLLAPGGAEPRAAGGQRARHAVQHAHAIHVRRQRIAHVLSELARRLGP